MEGMISKTLDLNLYSAAYSATAFAQRKNRFEHWVIPLTLKSVCRHIKYKNIFYLLK